MGIQTVIWICERCGVIVTYSESVSPWDDPVVRPPDGWDYLGDNEMFVCVECLPKDPDAPTPV